MVQEMNKTNIKCPRCHSDKLYKFGFERVFSGLALKIVCFIQFIVSYISSIYLYKTFNMFSSKKYISILVVAIYSCSVVIMGLHFLLLHI